MIPDSSHASCIRENEALWFWTASQEARQGEDRMTALDDLLTIATMTEWPLLKRRCAATLAAPMEARG